MPDGVAGIYLRLTFLSGSDSALARGASIRSSVQSVMVRWRSSCSTPDRGSTKRSSVGASAMRLVRHIGTEIARSPGADFNRNLSALLDASRPGPRSCGDQRLQGETGDLPCWLISIGDVWSLAAGGPDAEARQPSPTSEPRPRPW